MDKVVQKPLFDKVSIVSEASPIFFAFSHTIVNIIDLCMALEVDRILLLAVHSM